MEKLIEGAGKLGIEFNARQINQFEIYYQELIQWNKRVNLTAITDYSDVQVKHFLDSLTITLALSKEALEKPNFNIIDIGTGAGFPGMPLKILLPQTRLTLIESTSKKTAFLDHIIQKLALDDVDVINNRAEEIAHAASYREQFNLVISRALAPLATLAELALPFCYVGGRFVAQKKGECSQEISKAQKAITVMGGKLEQVKKIELEEFNDERYLVIVDKICTTSGKYPRRPGIPGRRPIQEV